MKREYNGKGWSVLNSVNGLIVTVKGKRYHAIDLRDAADMIFDMLDLDVYSELGIEAGEIGEDI